MPDYDWVWPGMTECGRYFPFLREPEEFFAFHCPTKLEPHLAEKPLLHALKLGVVITIVETICSCPFLGPKVLRTVAYVMKCFSSLLMPYPVF